MIANAEAVVYLTKYSFLYLCRCQIEVEVKKEELYNIFKKYIIDDYGVYKIFNSSEIKNFIAQLSFLKEDEMVEEDVVIILKQYNRITERKDSYTHIYDKGGKIKYHLYQDCIAMKEKYVDFRVPSEFHTLIEPKNLQNFLSQHHKTIDGYARRLRDYELFENEKTRKRLEEYESLIEKYSPNNEDVKYRQDAVERLRKIFRDSGNELEYIENFYNKELINEYVGLKKITQGYFSGKKEEKRNSGIEESVGKGFDYQAMINELNLIVQERRQLCNLTILDNFISKYDNLANKSDSDIKRVIGDWKLKDEDRILLKHYTIPILKDFWTKHRKLKCQAMSIINDYIQYKYNFDGKNFIENMLIEYGLECCAFCENKRMLEIF